MEFQLFTGKNVEDALTKASVELGVTSDRVEYEVIEKGSSGFIGIGSKPAKINARVKEEEVIKCGISFNIVGVVKRLLCYTNYRRIFKANFISVFIYIIIFSILNIFA